ncbi:MAG: asparagine synthase (glutamine-hydrolyzing) [Byssovorax sp.]
MCGIAGILRFDAPPDEARVARMERALAHRGPDGRGLVSSGAACLAHTRLSLLDHAGSAQPFRSRDGRYLLTYNGEIYNHRELRAELASAWDFQTRGDVEVVLAACARWGEGALARFDGMFAFCLWDTHRQEAFLARDRLGVKPLVYARTEHGWMFASEAKALLAADHRPPRAHAPSILEYLVAPCFSGVEHGMFEHVEHLQPGHRLKISRAGVEIAPWWELRLDPDARESASLIPSLRAALGAAVAGAMRADVPVGAFLSGGLDSTILTALAAREADLATFTVAFEGQESYDYARSAIVVSDDGPFAALCARELGVAMETVSVPRAGLAGDLARIAAIDDALPAWEQEIAQHHLARAASRRVKAVLVGDAADETHYGYHFLLDAEATSSPAAIVRRLGSVPVRRDRWADPVGHLDAHYRALVACAGGRYGTPRERQLATTLLILKRWLPRLLHNGDIHTMAFGLEARVPFASPALLDLALAIPPELGLRGGVEKWALREAVRDLVPEAVRVRRKSALPKDQGAGEIWRAEARRAIGDHREFLSEFLDLEAIQRWLAPGTPLEEWERAALFRIAALGAWAGHHGVVSATQR